MVKKVWRALSIVKSGFMSSPDSFDESISFISIWHAKYLCFFVSADDKIQKSSFLGCFG